METVTQAFTLVNKSRPQSFSLQEQLNEVWPLGLNHSTSKAEKSERARRRNEADNRLFAEFARLVVDYCDTAKLDRGTKS
jgi:hypothetical protein